MSSLNVIKDDSGASFIPSSQRPDGTWRKPIRVRDGYVPQEEQPLYVSKGKQSVQTSSAYPVGLSSSDVDSYNSSKSLRRQNMDTFFEVGNYTPATVIPGLNFLETEDPGKGFVKAKSKKNKKKSSESGDDMKANTDSSQAKNPVSKTSSAAGDANQPTDPAKRLRNLRKRLKDIESLEKRISSGDLSNPEKEQLEKINRKDDVLDEIEDLERIVGELSLS